jgi:hypothetical protein
VSAKRVARSTPGREMARAAWPSGRLLITGDRAWTDESTIAAALEDYDPSDWVVIHGGARGADSLAGRIAAQRGHMVIRVPALWNVWGNAAGIVRNNVMLDLGPDVVLAFHDDLARSRGTAHCVREAQRRGIPVRHFTSRA